MPEEIYEFGDATYDRLDAAGLSPVQVLQVLHGGQRIRRSIAAVLQIAGIDHHGRWLAVTLIETAIDDRYTVIGARELDPAEVEAVHRMRGEQP